MVILKWGDFLVLPLPGGAVLGIIVGHILPVFSQWFGHQLSAALGKFLEGRDFLQCGGRASWPVLSRMFEICRQRERINQKSAAEQEYMVFGHGWRRAQDVMC